MEAVFDLGAFRLQSGDTLPNAKLSYETHGELNQGRDNVVVYPTWYGGRHSDNREFIGDGRALDSSEYFIVVPDMFGNGLSSSPSNTPAPFDRARFPLITPYDNVIAQRRLLTEEFGVERIALVIGYSMSAQQAFHWAALYPDAVERIAAICGSSKTSPHNWLFLEGVKTAMRADAAWAGGDYESPPEAGIRAFATVYAGWFASQTFYRNGTHLSLLGQQFSSMTEYLDFITSIFGTFDANDLLAMVATWQAADVSAHPNFEGDVKAALGAMSARALVMPCQMDLYFPPEDNELEVAAMPNATLNVIPSTWGHLAGHPGLAPSEDVAFMESAVRELLSG